MTSQNFASIDNISSESILLSGGMINGRVDLLSKMPQFNVSTFQSPPTNNYRQEALKQTSKTEVSELFFSPMNINALQDGIKNKILNETDGKFLIGRQNDQELKIIMRSIYLQYSSNNEENCVEQVRKLNALVLNWAVPEILSNLLQYQTYRKDASTLPMPFEHPQLLSQKGSRQNELKNFF